MKKDNITDLNEYKSQSLQENIPVEELSDEMLNAYFQAADMDTPDLWSKIEEGYKAEYLNIEREKYIKKASRRKVTGIVAAAVLITIIAVPMLMLGGNRGDTKSNDMITNEDSIKYQDAETDGVMNEAVEENVAEIETENTEADSINHENTTENIYGVATDDRTLLVYGELTDYNEEEYTVKFKVEEVISNDYEEYAVKKGDIIDISNPSVIYVMDNSFFYWEIEFDSLNVNEQGEYVARINSMVVKE